MSRESLLAATVADLAETLSADFDPLDFLQSLTRRAVELMGSGGAALLLSDHRGELQLVSATSPAAEAFELFALAARTGPCVTAYRTGRPVLNVRPEEFRDRWRRLVDHAPTAGVPTVHALPVEVRPRVIGALGLHWSEPHPLSADDIAVARAVTSVMSVGLVHERTSRRREVLAEQLQSALNAKVTVEQSKGVVAEVLGLSVVEAFALVSSYAARHSLALGQVAQELVRRELDPHLLAGDGGQGAPPGI